MDSAQRPVMSFLGYNKIKTKSLMAAGKFQMAMSHHAMVHPIHFMFSSRVNMIQTTIIKQQIFIKTAVLNTLVTMTIVLDVDNSKN